MNFNRRDLLTSTVTTLAAAGVVSRTTAAEQAATNPRTQRGIVDCQSHLFFPQVLDAMRQRTAEPLVYDEDGTTVLKMGPWLRKVPPLYYDVDAKLAAMDAAGIEVTLLSNNDPGPEWFGEDGGMMARVIHDSIHDVCRQHPGRFYGLCALPMQDQSAAEAELRRCVEKLDFRGILLYTNLAAARGDAIRARFQPPGSVAVLQRPSLGPTHRNPGTVSQPSAPSRG